jgi:glutaredoxin 3
MPAEVKLYTTTTCPYCYRAKAVLAKRGIAYQEINVSNDFETRDWLVKTTGRKTVPQIFIAGEPIGGSDELVALDRAGELVKRVFGSETPATGS